MNYIDKMFIYIIIGFFILWLVFLSLIVYKVRDHYRRLIKTTKKEKIEEILEVLMENSIKSKKNIQELEKEILAMKKESYRYIQKIGMVRFNPFKEVGGDQSFVISLLDKNDNGIVINFIYTREGLRVYSKRVKRGKGEGYSLSEEEYRAVKKAIS